MDKVTVIVPVYNVEKYLNRCVNSILNQSYGNLEIILVDDESPDRSGEICEAIKENDERVKVIHKKNGGLGFARNSGLEIATGEYVTFIDSDDWISHDHIENLLKYCKDNNADLCIGGHINTDGNTSSETVSSVTMDLGLYEGEKIISDILLPLISPDVDYQNDIQLESSSCMNLYKMGVIKANNLRFISEKYAVAEDLYFNIDFLSRTNRVYVSDEVGYYYFTNPGSISRKYDPKRFERTINFYEEITKRVKQYGLMEKVNYRIQRSYLTKTRVAIKLISASDLPLIEKHRQIKFILNHHVTRKVISEYPINTYIPALRLTAYLMKFRCAWGMLCIMSIRDSAKNSALLARLLNKVGIGRT